MGKEDSRGSQPRICVVSVCYNPALNNLFRILTALGPRPYFVCGNPPSALSDNPDLRLVPVKVRTEGQSLLTRSVCFIVAQLKFARVVWKVALDADVIIFRIANNLLLPMLIARLRGKKTVLDVGGSESKGAKLHFRKSLFGIGGIVAWLLLTFVESFTQFLAHRVTVETPSAVGCLAPVANRRKIMTESALCVDTDLMKPMVSLTQRANLVGYLGNLSPRKGVINLAKAIRLMSNQTDRVKFCFIGDGPLRQEMEKDLSDLINRGQVSFAGFVAREKIPEYLNQMKLLVLPSYLDTEGLPNTILEAMACGTPVLASPVSGTPDVVRHGETGFLLKDNQPQSIARGITEALNSPDLEKVAREALTLVERDYDYSAAIKRFKHIIGSVWPK